MPSIYFQGAHIPDPVERMVQLLCLSGLQIKPHYASKRTHTEMLIVCLHNALYVIRGWLVAVQIAVYIISVVTVQPLFCAQPHQSLPVLVNKIHIVGIRRQTDIAESGVRFVVAEWVRQCLCSLCMRHGKERKEK